MARIRTVKPEYWGDEKFAPLDPIHRLVFLGLISHADDAGRLLDQVRLLDGLIFPMTDQYSCAESLELFAGLKRIKRYQAESGQRIIQIVNWEEHQKVKSPSERVLPAPADNLPAAETPETLPRTAPDSTPSLPRSSPDSPPILPPGSRIRDQGSGILDQGSRIRDRSLSLAARPDEGESLPGPETRPTPGGKPASKQSGSTSKKRQPEQPATRAPSLAETSTAALVEYVGEELRGVVESCAAMPGAGRTWAAGLMATYGHGESLEARTIPPADRPAVLGIALRRYSTDRQDWYSPGFRAFVDRAAAEVRAARESGEDDDARRDQARAAREFDESERLRLEAEGAKLVGGEAADVGEMLKRLRGKLGPPVPPTNGEAASFEARRQDARRKLAAEMARSNRT